jgi:hypothetical protein
MSLIDAFKTPCVLMEKTRTSDGEGGWIPTWTEGPEFEAAIVLDSSTTARLAEVEGLTAVYTVTTDRNVKMDYQDALRRVSDGKTFRVTKVNDPTPSPATFQFNQYQAEAWELA